MRHSPYSPTKTLYKAFKIIELLGQKQPVRPSELAQQLKLSRSNVHRLLSTLCDLGYVEKSHNSGYRLSFKIFMVGSAVPRLNQLSDIAHPLMVRLAQKSQENVNLAIMYEGKVLYIDKIESSHYLKLDQPIGRTDPMHCTALGKVLLSGFDRDELKAFLKSSKLKPYTKNTITDPEALLRSVENVRKLNYAIDLEELNEGIHCIAAPIRDHTNKIIAAISISAPAIRLGKKRIGELKGPLVEISTEISKKLGSTY